MRKYKWHIFLATLDPVVGSEQGKTNTKIFPNEVLIPANTGGLGKESIVLCYQIRTLDKK